MGDAMSGASKSGVCVLGVFAGDTVYRAKRQPRVGETILGESFALTPGGKGSNQAVAAARLGARTRLVTRLGDDAFADLAEATWREAGVEALAPRDPDAHTGAAFIFVDAGSGDNAIIVAPGAAGRLGPGDIERAREAIAGAAVFVTQLEQPLEAATAGLRLAREAGTTTVLNPAPAADLSDELLALCDWLTPNEAEAEGLTGIVVSTLADAERAGRALLERGAGRGGGVVVTLGERGALLVTATDATPVPARPAGPVAETTGAGDCFTAAFAVGLAEGMAPVDAVGLGCAAAGLQVTRPGAAAAMPTRAEVNAALAGGAGAIERSGEERPGGSA